jgi:hypothetical protein
MKRNSFLEEDLRVFIEHSVHGSSVVSTAARHVAGKAMFNGEVVRMIGISGFPSGYKRLAVVRFSGLSMKTMCIFWSSMFLRNSVSSSIKKDRSEMERWPVDSPSG